LLWPNWLAEDALNFGRQLTACFGGGTHDCEPLAVCFLTEGWAHLIQKNLGVLPRYLCLIANLPLENDGVCIPQALDLTRWQLPKVDFEQQPILSAI